MSEWVRENYTVLGETIAGSVEHRGGVAWHKAPEPRRWHRCVAQTRAVDGSVERCACGAMRFDGIPGWGFRNERRRDRRRARRRS